MELNKMEKERIKQIYKAKNLNKKRKRVRESESERMRECYKNKEC